VSKLLLDRREAMEALGVGLRKLRELSARGLIHEVRLGRRCIRYSRESVERLASPRREGEGSDAR
jgi:predicted site-specific integrase-resolvase